MYAVHRNWLAFAMVFLSVILRGHVSSENDCSEIHFLNQKDDVIRSVVNRDINITFAIRWVNCSSPSGHRILIVSEIDSRGPIGIECKIPLGKSNCTVSDQTTSCSCVSKTGPVTFIKRFHKATNITYVWTWYNGNEEKEKAIAIYVYEDSNVSSSSAKNDTDHAHHWNHKTLVAPVLGSFAILLTVGIIVLVVCLKKVRRSRDPPPSQGQRTYQETRPPFGNSKLPLAHYEDPWDAIYQQNNAGTPETWTTQPEDWVQSPTQIYSNTDEAESSDQIYRNFGSDSFS